MDIIGSYYAPPIRSKNNRIRAKDKVDVADQSDWDDHDVRLRRIGRLEERLAELREREARRERTPVYVSKQANISAWIGTVAVEQDAGQSSNKAFQAYKKMETLKEEEA